MIQKILVGETYQSKGKGTALVTGYDPIMNMYKVLYSNGEIEFVNEYGLATHIDNINSTEYDFEETFLLQDDIQVSTGITLEDIKKQSWKYDPRKKLDIEFIRAAFVAGAQWYKEQVENNGRSI